MSVEGWRCAVELGEVCDVRSGYAFKSKDWTETGVPVVKIQNVRAGIVDLAGCSFVSDQTAAEAARYELQKGDLLITMSGEIGSVGRVRTQDRMLLNQRVGRFEIHDSELEIGFLEYLLRLPSIKRQMEQVAYGVAQPNISPTLIKQLKVNLPPLAEQQLIAARLLAFDDLIENSRRRIEILEEMARLIYREWFVHYRFPGHEGVELVDSELGPIPDGWTAARFGDLVETVTDSRSPEEISPDVALVGLEHLPRRSTTLLEWGSALDVGSRKTAFEPGDVLFGKIRPYFHKVVSAPIGGVCSTDAIVFRPIEPRMASHALSVASDDQFVAMATATSNGTKMPRANVEVLLDYPIALGPLTFESEFQGVVGPMVELAKSLAAANRVLVEARDLLLPRLVSGELDVSELDLQSEAVS